MHKDIKRIDINGTPYSFSVNEAEKKFVKPEADAFITLSDVTKLSEPDADEVPTDGWVLYYKTDVEVKDGAAKKDYTICLADAEGLVSGALKASTKPNKAEAETIRITKGTQISGSGSEMNPIIIGTDSAGAELTASSPTENTTVHCTVSEIGGAAPAKYDGNPVTVPLPLNGAGEKKYKLEYYTDGADFTATPVTTVYYKVAQEYAVTFSVDGGNGSLKGANGTEEKTATTSTQTITVPHGESVTFTAVPDTLNGYEVDSWTGVMPSPPNSTTATLSNVTEDKTVTVKFEKMTTINAGSGAWKLLKKAVEIADANAVITINGTIQATNEGLGATANWGEIIIDKNLTIKGKTGAGSDILNANSTTTDPNAPATKHRIFKVESGKTLTIQNLTLTGGIADGTGEAGTGGAIYAKGATVNITGCTLKGNTAKTGGAICAEKDGSTGSTVTVTGGTIGGTTEAEANKATGTGSDNGFGGAIFVKGATVNINGCTLEGNKAKNGGGVYMEGGNCTLNGSLKNNKTTEPAASSGGSIYLENGTLTMKTGAEISGSEASVSGGGVYISARGGGAASFTMEGGTISGCKVSSAYPVDGGGVCVEVVHGSTGTANFIMQGGSITGCKAVINDNAGTPKSQGGGVYMENSTFNMSGSSSITGCTAESSDSSPSGSPSFYGGGVYVAGSTATFTMKDSAVITPPSEEPSGMKRFNDVYLDNGAKITVAGTLSPEDGIAARITVPDDKYLPTTQVLEAGTGVTLENETYKFAVTPKTVSGTTQNWTVNGQGCLKQSRHTEVPYSQLEACLANASSTEVNHIEITGTIPAADLKRPTGSSGAAELGEKIKAADPKKVALKLPDGLSDVTSMRGCFAVCRNLISVENIPSNVTDMCCCFFVCASLITAPDIPSGVTNMRECFSVCESLTVAPNIPSGVTDMAYCFNSCFKLTQGPDIPSSVTDMESCFRNCKVLERVKINRGYTVGCFNNTFEYCTALQDGGIQVPNGSYNDYTTDNALTYMSVPGSTPAEKKAKFSGF